MRMTLFSWSSFTYRAIIKTNQRISNIQKETTEVSRIHRFNRLLKEEFT